MKPSLYGPVLCLPPLGWLQLNPIDHGLMFGVNDVPVQYVYCTVVSCARRSRCSRETTRHVGVVQARLDHSPRRASSPCNHVSVHKTVNGVKILHSGTMPRTPSRHQTEPASPAGRPAAAGFASAPRVSTARALDSEIFLFFAALASRAAFMLDT